MYTSPHTLSGDGYIQSGWRCSEAITDYVYGSGACNSAALMPDFLCTMVPQVPLTARQCARQAGWPFCPWNSWCFVMYSAVDSFFRPMNFNNFFLSLLKHWVFPCMSPHCWILFFLLPFRTPITTCPVEKQSCATQSKMETVERMSISSNRLRGLFFFLRGKIRFMSNLRSNELNMRWRQLVLSDNGWG